MDTSTALEPSPPSSPSSSSSSSSSSSYSSSSPYDVFLSFGEDTRKTFTDHLYWTMKDAGIDFFMEENESIRRGENISDKVKQIIEGSKVSVIVFSSGYVDSIWCLEELVQIMECSRTLKQKILPIFYDLSPPDYKDTLKPALEKHARRFLQDKDIQEKLRQWADALTEDADLTTRVFRTTDGYEGKFIRKIIGKITGQLDDEPDAVLPTEPYTSRTSSDSGKDPGFKTRISSAGLELANLLVTSPPLRQSWDAVQKQKLRTAADPNAQMALYDISETKQPNTTIISFLAPPVTLKDQQAMISSTTLKNTNFPLFEFLCNKDTPSFSVNKLAISFFASNYTNLKILLTKLVESINSNPLILITGHSFGGCVATLFTLWLLQSLDLSKVKRPLCITFGSPLIGDENLRQCVLQFSTWSSCFLNVASINDPVPKVFLTASQASDYKPFGTFLLCSASGCSCFEDPNAILQLLVETGSQSAQIQGPKSGIQFFDYGQILSDLKLKAFLRDVFELVEEDRFPLKAGIKTQLAAIFGVTSSQSLQQQQPDINFGNLMQKMETQERNHTIQKAKVYSSFWKLNEIKKYMASMEWYKEQSKRMGIGYYDSYKNKRYPRDINAVEYKKKLWIYWQDTVAEVERKPQKEGATMRTRFLFAGNTYRSLIEPLHIADYYMEGGKDYIKERPRHFVLLEQWFNEDEEKKNPQLRSESKSNSKVKNVASSLNADSCFWAHVEEALILCNEQASNPDAKQMLVEFEQYVLNSLEKFAVTPDIFLAQSSYMQWWNEYKKRVGNDYSSPLAKVMKRRTYTKYAEGVSVLAGIIQDN